MIALFYVNGYITSGLWCDGYYSTKYLLSIWISNIFNWDVNGTNGV